VTEWTAGLRERGGGREVGGGRRRRRRRRGGRTSGTYMASIISYIRFNIFIKIRVMIGNPKQTNSEILNFTTLVKLIKLYLTSLY
jgi:hypothetical protein